MLNSEYTINANITIILAELSLQDFFLKNQQYETN